MSLSVEPDQKPVQQQNEQNRDLGSEPSDDALLQRVGVGDERAYTLLVTRHSGRVHAIAQRFALSGAGADDIVQEVWWRVWKAAPNWQTQKAKFTSWLHRVTVNCCIDWDRKQKRWGWLMPLEDNDMDDGNQSIELAFAARAELATVRSHMINLPAKQRLALTLSCDQELSNAQIADAMESTEGAVEQLLVRARRTLRDKMREIS